MSKTWKILLIIFGIVLVLIILASVFGGKGNKTEIFVEAAEPRSLTEKVSASGKIQPEMEVKIQSEVSGQIIELPVKEGDVVLKGQLLVKINPDIYIQTLNRADAALNSAKSNLSSARARLAQSEAQFKAADLSYQRTKKLVDEGAVSKAEFDTVTSTWETAKAEVTAAKESINSAEFAIESAQAGRQEAGDNLKRTTILAPQAGTVTALTKEMGETVLGNNMMAGDVIMKISAMDLMEVNVEVNESDIVRVNLGDTADVEVDAYEDEKFKGVITEISNTALNTLSGAAMSMDQVTNFSVKIRILHESYSHLCKEKPESYSPFRPGMSATVDVLTDHANNVLTVPIKAVTTREDTTSASLMERIKKKKLEEKTIKNKPDEPFTVVFVLDETTNKCKLRVVKTGIQDDEFIHIVEGLTTNEKVITGPYDEVSRKLKPGKEVQVKEEAEEGESDEKEEEEDE